MDSEQNSSPEVAVLGAAAVDWVARVKRFPRQDSIVYAEEFMLMPGGSGGNVAAGVAQLGHRVRFLGLLGDDDGGQLLLRAFMDVGVDTCCTRVEKGQRSASCFITIDEHGERQIVALGGVALYDKAEDINPAWLKNVQILFIADAYQEVVSAASASLDVNARVVFNPGGLMAGSGREYTQPFMERADVLIVSEVEAEAMTGESDTHSAIRELARRGPDVVMLTLGRHGALTLENGKTTHIPAVEVTSVVDTTGAGDAFSSGVIAGMLEGLNWTDSARMGCVVASFKIRHLGGRGGLPNHGQVQALLESM